MRSWNHLRARKAADFGKPCQVEANEIGDEQEESAAPGREGSRGQLEGPSISNWLHGRSGRVGAFLLKTPRKRGESFHLEHFAHCSGTERASPLLQSRADLINGVVPFAEIDNEIASSRLLRLRAWTVARGNKEDRFWVATEVVAENVERSDRIAECLCDIMGGTTFDIVGPQRLVHALLGVAMFEEKATASA